MINCLATSRKIMTADVKHCLQIIASGRLCSISNLYYTIHYIRSVKNKQLMKFCIHFSLEYYDIKSIHKYVRKSVKC